MKQVSVKMLFRQCLLQFRAISTSNVCRFASVKKYPVPPRQEYVDGYLQDFRTDRQLVKTVNSNSGEKKQLRVEILDEADLPMIGQMVCDHFMKHISIVSELSKCF